MRAAPDRARRNCAGFTILELALASVVMVVLWYSLTEAMSSGTRSQQVLMQAATELAEVRRSNGLLLEDLRATSAETLRLEESEDGTTRLELQHPIRVEGVQTWGVRTPGRALDAETNGEPGWSIRYAVSGSTESQAPGPRSLVRQVLDAEGEIQSEQVIVTELDCSNAEKPGFTVTPEGAMWAVHIVQANDEHGPDGPGTVFHVRTRN